MQHQSGREPLNWDVGFSFMSEEAVVRGRSEVDLYVHVPFCTSKCHFCSWVAKIPTSELLKQEKIFDLYTDAVIRQIEGVSRAARQRMEDTLVVGNVYFGGGTPSILPARHLVRILEKLETSFQKPRGTVTLEASPDTLTYEKLRELRIGGFDRVSLGVQSFDDEVLRKMGRASRSVQCFEAVEAVRKAGFEDLNLDLILGLPYQTSASWKETLRLAVELAPDHLSPYCYVPIEGTVGAPLFRESGHELCKPSPFFEHYLWTTEFLSSHGYAEYLFSLFEKNGNRCLSDESYFKLQKHWLGFGAGAHSLFGKQVGYTTPDTYQFIANPLRTTMAAVRRHPSAIRKIVFQMLLTDGIDTVAFEERLGFSFDHACREDEVIGEIVAELKKLKLVKMDHAGLTWTGTESRAKWHITMRDRTSRLLAPPLKKPKVSRPHSGSTSKRNEIASESPRD